MTMEIISHRGWWLSPEEKNTAKAFQHSFKNGYGTETDVRDYKGKLVIAHDIPDEASLPFQEFLDIYNENPGTRLAINIKADGLGALLESMMIANEVTNWFTFDMSIPELVRQLKQGLPCYTRISEVEDLFTPQGIRGVWVDCFGAETSVLPNVKRVLQNGFTPCVVSPELHGRDPYLIWTELLNLPETGKIILCTDIPDKATSFFG